MGTIKEIAKQTQMIINKGIGQLLTIKGNNKTDASTYYLDGHVVKQRQNASLPPSQRTCLRQVLLDIVVIHFRSEAVYFISLEPNRIRKRLVCPLNQKFIITTPTSRDKLMV
jgi:hypothetical protein